MDPNFSFNPNVNPYSASQTGGSEFGAPPPRIEPKHSGLGIASFALSIFSGVMLFVMIVIAGVMEQSTPGGMDENAPEVMLLGFGILGFGFCSFVAFILGIAGLFQSNTKKILAVLGLLFSGMVMLGTLGLVVLGLAMGA